MLKTLITSLSIFFIGTLFSQIDSKDLRGTWALVGIDGSIISDTVMIYFHDPRSISTLKKANYSVQAIKRDTSHYTLYKAFRHQFISFNEQQFGCGYAKDTTFKQAEHLVFGDYTISDSLLKVSFILTRTPDNQFYATDFGTEYLIKIFDDMIELKVMGDQMSYYYRRINRKVIFRN